jgi:type II secretory pathway component PulF
LHGVPMLGTARRELALARLAAALEALLSAGVTVIEAWDMAVLASGSPALRRAVARWQPQVRAGKTPGEAVSEASVFPELFANLYRTGEISGQLDDSLRNLHRHYQEEGTRKLHLVAQWSPRLAYLVIMLLIAWRIVHFYLGYFQQVNDAINMVP